MHHIWSLSFLELDQLYFESISFLLAPPGALYVMAIASSLCYGCILLGGSSMCLFSNIQSTHSGKRAQNRLKTSLHINKSYFRKVINKQIGLFFENLSDLVVDGFSFLLLANWNTVQNATIQVLLKLLYILYLYCTCTNPASLARKAAIRTFAVLFSLQWTV